MRQTKYFQLCHLILPFFNFRFKIRKNALLQYNVVLFVTIYDLFSFNLQFKQTRYWLKSCFSPFKKVYIAEVSFVQIIKHVLNSSTQDDRREIIKMVFQMTRYKHLNAHFHHNQAQAMARNKSTGRFDEHKQLLRPVTTELYALIHRDHHH